MQAANRFTAAQRWLFYVLVSAAIFFTGAYFVTRSPYFDFTTIEVRGALEHLSAQQVREKTRRALKGNFFLADLTEIRIKIGALPWVRRVDVRRIWPGKLEVFIEEHQALAKWEANGLVNTYGEHFLANLDELDDELPVFMGPAQYTKNIAHYYSIFKTILQPLDAQPTYILLTPRFAWRMRLDNGMALELGRVAMEERLQKFVDVTLATPMLEDTLAYVDLRYANGFAVRFAKGVS